MRGANGLLRHDPRYWLFLDWAPLFREGYPAVYNLFYLLALRAAVRLLDLCNDKVNARLCSGREKALYASIEKSLLDAGKRKILGGRDWKNKPVDQDSVHTYSLAILLDIWPGHHREMAEKHLLPAIGEVKTGSVSATSFYSFYVFEALKKTGHGRQVMECIRRRWGRYVDAGLTTTPEGWDTTPNVQSLCHAWSAHPVVHFSNISLGVWQEAAAWKRIRFAPHFSGMDHARGKVAVPQGVIESAWERTAKGVEARLSLPAGVSALIDLPGVKRQTVAGKGRWRFQCA
jgi:hypothetical protein